MPHDHGGHSSTDRHNHAALPDDHQEGTLNTNYPEYFSIIVLTVNDEPSLH